MTFEQYLKQLGRNLKAARVRAGLRQIDVEEKIGLGLRRYQDMEAGKINITMRTLFGLARLFKTNAEDLTRGI